MNRIYLGVDVSKKMLDAAVAYDEEAESLGSFPNNAEGYAQLKQKVLEHGGKECSIHLVIEPTGVYHLELVAYAYEEEWQVSLPNPQIVRVWARGQGVRVKLDSIDARTLAMYGFKEEPKPQQPLAAEVQALDELLHRQDDLEKMLTQERNRLHSHQRRPNPAPQVTDSIEALIGSLEQALADVEQAIEEHLKNFAALDRQRRLLLKVPGIGKKSVLRILVFLHRWDARTSGLGDAKGLTAFAGLDPVPYASGTSVYKRPAISKMGDADIRRLLFLCALGGNRAKNTPLTQFYQRLVTRHKPHMVALVACARKILVWAFAVFRSGEAFDPARALSKT